MTAQIQVKERYTLIQTHSPEEESVCREVKLGPMAEKCRWSPAEAGVSCLLPPQLRWGGLLLCPLYLCLSLQKVVSIGVCYMCSPYAFDKTHNFIMTKMVICDLGDRTVWDRVTILREKC